MATAKKKGTAAKVATGVKKASSDLIVATAQEVENLTPAKAFALIVDLTEDIEQNSFKLGGALSVVREKCEAGEEEWLGDSASFRELCNTKFGLHYRKAMYMIEIYRNLVEKQIPWALVKNLGWSKLAVIAKVLTVKNVEKWVEKANKLTYLQLVETVKAQVSKGTLDTNASDSDSTVTSMTFKLKKDQKEVVREALDQVKSETKTEFDSVALTNLATALLGGAVQIILDDGGEEADKPAAAKVKNGKPPTKKEKKETMAALMKDLGLEDSLEVLGECFPEASITAEV